MKRHKLQPPASLPARARSGLRQAARWQPDAHRTPPGSRRQWSELQRRLGTGMGCQVSGRGEGGGRKGGVRCPAKVHGERNVPSLVFFLARATSQRLSPESRPPLSDPPLCSSPRKSERLPGTLDMLLVLSGRAWGPRGGPRRQPQAARHRLRPRRPTEIIPAGPQGLSRPGGASAEGQRGKEARTRSRRFSEVVRMWWRAPWSHPGRPQETHREKPNLTSEDF